MVRWHGSVHDVYSLWECGLYRVFLLTWQHNIRCLSTSTMAHENFSCSKHIWPGMLKHCSQQNNCAVKHLNGVWRDDLPLRVEPLEACNKIVACIATRPVVRVCEGLQCSCACRRHSWTSGVHCDEGQTRWAIRDAVYRINCSLVHLRYFFSNLNPSFS